MERGQGYAGFRATQTKWRIGPPEIRLDKDKCRVLPVGRSEPLHGAGGGTGWAAALQTRSGGRGSSTPVRPQSAPKHGM